MPIFKLITKLTLPYTEHLMKNVVALLLLLFLSHTHTAQDLNVLAQDFINTLGPELREKALFALDSDERFDYNYIPLLRDGPTFNEFSPRQKKAAHALLKASLSQKGYDKTQEIMKLEEVLRLLENDNATLPDGSLKRDQLNYHFCVFGDPDKGNFWGWRFEGHHASLNFVAEKGQIKSATPLFMGANPAVVPSGAHKGKEVLKEETDLGFALLRSLSPEQLQTALFSETAPADILTTNKRRVGRLPQKGIAYANLDKGQKALFDRLVELYLSNYEWYFARDFRKKIEASGFDNLSFAWAGSLKKGAGHYYSVQGPVLLIEYDNTQNDANHIHVVVRDLTNDFGQDVLGDHYKMHHR